MMTYISQYPHAKLKEGAPVKASEPNKVTVTGPGVEKEGVTSDQPVEFYVNAQGAGNGPLVAVVKGPEGSVEVLVDDKKDGTYTCSYVATEPGPHSVEVRWGGRPVPKSPFQVDVAPGVNAHACRAYGPGVEGGDLKEASPAEFWVETTGAGQGDLAIAVRGPKGPLTDSEIKCETVKEDKYQVTYTPPIPGQYSVEVTFADLHINGSPFRVRVGADKSNASKCSAKGPGVEGKGLVVGKETWFRVSTKGAGKGELSTNVRGPHGELPTKSVPKEPGVVEYKYTPSEIGEHVVTIKFGGDQIPGSRFRVQVEPPTDASKCVTTGLGVAPQGVRVKEPAPFTVKTKEAGHGDVAVAISGPKGKVPFEKKSAPYVEDFTYLPNEVGKYTVDVKFAGKPVPGSPFLVAATDASKVKITGPGMNGELLPVNKPLKYKVNAQGAGPGKLACAIQSSPKADETDLAECNPKITEHGNNTYDIEYTPTNAGVERMNVTFGEAPIPNTPIHLNLYDPSKVVAEGPGLEPGNKTDQQTFFTVDMRQAGEGQLQVALSGPEEIPVSIKDQANSIVRCEYTPTVAGEYVFNVLFEGEHIPNSPFSVPISATTDAALVKAYGPGVEATDLTTDSCTEFFVDFKEAGEGEVEVKVEGPAGGVELTEEVVEPGLKKYTYCTDPDEAGAYVTNITFADQQIPESPFKVPVTWKTDATRVKAEGPGLEGGIASEWTTFKIDMRQAGNGALNLGIEGPCEAPYECEDHEDGTVTIKYCPEEAGTYVINVQFADEHIPGSPFSPEFYPCTDSNKVKAYGPGLRKEGVKVGDPGDFTIDTRAGGTGAVDVTVNGPMGRGQPPGKRRGTITGAKPVITNNNDNTYAVVYNPRKVGMYSIAVLFAGEPIPESPFEVSVTDPSKVELDGPGVGEEEEEETFQVDDDLRWFADCSQAGPGKLEFELHGPEGASKEVNMVKLNEDSYTLDYTPKVPGNYCLDVKFASNLLEDSPKFTVADSSSVKVYGPALDGVKVGEKAVFHVDVSNAGEGQLSLLMKGPEEGKLTCDGTEGAVSTFSFTPNVSGEFLLTVKFADQEIPDSPYSIPVRDVTKIIVSGSGITGKGTCIGKPAEIIADTTASGPAPMRAKVTSPSGKTQVVAITPQESEERGEEDEEETSPIMTGEYTPKEIGCHTVEVEYAEQPVPDSPYNVPIGNPSAVRLSGDGLTQAVLFHDNVIDCFTEKAGPGDISATFAGPSPAKWSVTKESEHHQKLHYTVDTTGVYEATICYNELPVHDPYSIPTIDPGRCKVSGPGIAPGVVAERQTYFDVDTTEAGKGSLDVSVVSPSGEVPAKVSETVRGIYTATYTPPEAGDYTINVKFAGSHVEGSPFPVTVGDPGKVKCFGPGLESAIVNEPANFTVDISEAGEGPLEVTVKGPQDTPCNVNCKDSGGGIFKVDYTAPRPGICDIHVKFAGAEVAGSPFRSECQRPEADASKCHVSGIETPGSFRVDCRGAGGTGQLQVGVTGAYVPAEFVSVKHNGDYTFSVSYDIGVPGKTIISVMWHGAHLAGSPFTVFTE